MQPRLFSPADCGDVPEEMLLGQFIPLHYHFNMLQDNTRMHSFRDAIDLVVPVGGKVLELGGGTGVLSFFAAQRASNVWCVERNPAMVRAAKQFLERNAGGERVQVVQADAMCYLPPEPVDVVICEMLHVGLLREKQVDVLRSFSKRYLDTYGAPLPKFIPDACAQTVQPVEQNFDFCGYEAPIPLFVQAGLHEKEVVLAEPKAYSIFCYDSDIPERFQWSGVFTIQREGHLNALSFFTKNFLAFVLNENRSIDWPMNRLILPLPQPKQVNVGEQIEVRLSYRAGCPIEALQDSLAATSLERKLNAAA
jgi:type I protein arginine methyltransferase